MTDIALTWNKDRMSADLSLAGPDLLTDDGLNTAVLISLFTDRRASADDELPDGTTDRRGWWGDAFAEEEGDEIGSKLWLLERSKITAETIRLARDYAQAALDWLVTDGVARSVEVTAERRDATSLDLSIVITRPDSTSRTYDYVWDAYT